MKIGSTVIGVHVAAACLLGLTQGCVTSESQGSGRGAGARHKGVGGHVHRLAKQDNESTSRSSSTTQSFDDNMQIDDSPVIIDNPVIVTTPVVIATPKPYTPPVQSGGTYVVQKGDTLSGIAVKFGTNTKSLIGMNNLADPNRLFVGQEINVPGGGQKKSSYSSGKSSNSIKKGGSYMIQKGDSLSKIASRAGVSLADLRSVNNIKDDKIYAGETIIIPAHGKVPSTSTRKSSSNSSMKKSDPDPVEPEMPEMETASVEVIDDAPSFETSVSTDYVREYLVHEGETLESIARDNGVSKSDIMRYNNLSSSSDLRENMKLRIPVQ